ncbi:MAG: hypothetical protein IJY74_06360 [Oscillospiraceae bacterium]|nr:hypothetical protein [Oscillospiraceae bacterium]
MEYQIKDIVKSVEADIHCGSVTFIRGTTENTTRVSIEGFTEDDMRVYPVNGVLYIRAITGDPVHMTIYGVPTIKGLKVVGEKTSVSVDKYELDRFSATVDSDVTLTAVTVNKQCDINTTGGKISLTDCELTSMNAQVKDGVFDIQRSVLHGNNILYTHNSPTGGLMRGALVDYMVTSGGQISDEQVVVNDHYLTDFPVRKNTQNVAWLLVAGETEEEIVFSIKRPNLK